MSVLTFNKDNFSQEVLESDKPVLVDFWASWCGPCKMLAPILDEVASEAQTAKIGKINVDEEPELARQFRVMSIPTMILFKDGQAVKTSVGVKPKNEILSMLD
ncbi:MAG: thioredoxin [Clostridiales bacterium]|nr:thioredoxin [Clostridiales bacterium]HZJ75321.1 thioredoxin [Clostridia bacterium]